MFNENIGDYTMITRDFKIKPNDKELKRLAGKRIERILKSERNRIQYEQAKKELIELVKPAVGWNLFPIRKFEHDQILLENGIKIGGGPVVKVVGGAEKILLAICTIGKEVDDRIKQHMKEGNMFQGVFLDEMGTWAVDFVRKEFCKNIKNDLHENRGYRTSTTLSPGESTWSMKDQAVIFDLLHDEAAGVGVSLNSSMVMNPLKSISVLIGAGTQPMGSENGTNCDYCTMKDKCRHNHMRA